MLIPPERINADLAVFSQFVPTLTDAGDPILPFDPRGYATARIGEMLEQLSACGVGNSEAVAMLGFSKGAIVINQLIAELPIAGPAVLARTAELHFVDAGLNVIGVHLHGDEYARALQALAQLRHAGSAVAVVVHGTPRQWRSPERPWIHAEAEAFVQQLAGLGGRVTKRLYFENRKCGLLEHFGILEVLDATT